MFRFAICFRLNQNHTPEKALIRHGLRRATFPQGKALGCAAKLNHNYLP